MIRTQRCVIHCLRGEDTSDLEALYRDKEVWRYLGGLRNEVQIKSDIGRAVAPPHPAQYFAVRNGDNNAFLGIIFLDTHHNGADIEISYAFLSAVWGSGLAYEAVKAVMQYTFQSRNLAQLLAETQARNKHSCNMLQRLGFTETERIIRFGATQIIFVIPRHCAM